MAKSTTHASSPTTIMVEKNRTWGPILALSSGWTVYRFVPDGTGKSTCYGKCAQVWPPVLLGMGQKEPMGEEGVAHLGAITRTNGTRQVTYEGIPLYLFIGDKKPGQVTGNIKDSFGQWWTVNPAHPMATPKASGSGSSTTTTLPSSGVAY